MNSKIINSICRLKKKKEKTIEEVEVRYPHPRELIDDLVAELDDRNMHFHGKEDMISYLTYLIERSQHKKKVQPPEIDYRHIKCDCGTIWKIFVKPDEPIYVTKWEDFDDMLTPIKEEQAVRFICSMCKFHIVVRNAVLIYKAETEQIPPEIFKRRY